MEISQIILYLTIFAFPAWAAQINNVSGCITSNNALQVQGEYCGQGQSTIITVSGTSTITQQCFTKSGNPVQGRPKKSSTPFTTDFPFDPTGTGCQPFCFTTNPPAATLNCGPSQEARVLSVSYSGVTIVGSNAPSPARIGTVTGSCTSTC